MEMIKAKYCMMRSHVRRRYSNYNAIAVTNILKLNSSAKGMVI